MILVGDVGGTKTNLALYCQTDGEWQCLRKQKYFCADFYTFAQILNEFCLTEQINKITAVCIGVAGPINDGNCYATNLSWTITRDEISKILNTFKVHLINDLVATAWGMLKLSEHEVVELNPDGQPKLGNIAVIAAGTGLGEAILCWDGHDLHAIATEGGHSDFAPNNHQEIELLTFLREKYSGHVSYERLVSGTGLFNIYQFLKATGFARRSEKIEKAIQTTDPATIIGAAALSGSDKLSIEALSIFCRIYGAETGNLALKCLPHGGIYLAGGIAPKILPYLRKDLFLQSFLNKGRYRSVLQNFPVRVCLNPDAALIGALEYITKMIDKENRCGQGN